MFKLTNKTAIVTGASRGIGKSIAKVLADAGALVFCVSRNKSDVDKIAEDINGTGNNAFSISCDISDAEDVSRLINNVVDKTGQIDILVNNAGITKDNLMMRMSADDWKKVIDINLTGTFFCTKAVTRAMLKQRSGRIINISSVVGITGNAGQSNYSASKAGIIGLTKSSAKELASRGITVNCIAPGYIETDMTDSISENAKVTILNKIPLGRIGNPKDIAYLVQFLASDEARYITGQTITADGGMIMN